MFRGEEGGWWWNVEHIQANWDQGIQRPTTTLAAKKRRDPTWHVLAGEPGQEFKVKNAQSRI